jgi:hypothetical protein
LRFRQERNIGYAFTTRKRGETLSIIAITSEHHSYILGAQKLGAFDQVVEPLLFAHIPGVKANEGFGGPAKALASLFA